MRAGLIVLLLLLIGLPWTGAGSDMASAHACAPAGVQAAAQPLADTACASAPHAADERHGLHGHCGGCHLSALPLADAGLPVHPVARVPALPPPGGTPMLWAHRPERPQWAPLPPTRRA